MTRIAAVEARALDLPLREPFGIAGGSQSRVRNVLVRARLEDGTVGWGECAPFPAFNGETQALTLRAVRSQRGWLEGRPAGALEGTSAGLARRIPERACARAGIEMALLDAFCRRRHLPLRVFFGGASDRVWTDVTIPIVPAAAAARAARRLTDWGIRTLKIKVGASVEEDAERVLAAAAQAPRARLIVDGNAGYDAAEALRFLDRLGRRGVRPALFEQPVPAADLRGLAAVSRRGRVPVAADESAVSAEAVLRLVRARAVQVVNLKLMKCGIFESLRMARIARAAGLRLMIGGMIESRLAMGCSAHLAAGLGGFDFIDLDTPLFFGRDPMRGLRILRGGLYDLRPVRSGIGVRPKVW